MGKNAEFVLGHSQYSSGRGIEGSIKGLVYVSLVVKRKIFARFVHSIWSSDFPCKSEINAVGKMASFSLTKILLMLTA